MNDAKWMLTLCKDESLILTVVIKEGIMNGLWSWLWKWSKIVPTLCEEQALQFNRNETFKNIPEHGLFTMQNNKHFI